MERVELALKKNSVCQEKPLPGGDDAFSVDDLLDFSNGDVFIEDKDESNVQRERGVSVSLNNGDNTIRRSNGFSTAGTDFGSFPTSELSIPMDDLAELEWLSNFVEDTFTPYSAPTKKPVWLTGNRKHHVTPSTDETCFKTPLPVRIRSKRARTGVSVWSLGSPSLTDSSSSSTTSSSSSSGPSSSDEPSFIKQKNKKKKPSSSETQTRRCSHCGVQKTPQWRAGPNGAKTLCNACGVRFKSGRLLPEYRPACSPTFSSELHSNHHRKVIEMRMKKETPELMKPL